jgi:hypothetical protein
VIVLGIGPRDAPLNCISGSREYGRLDHWIRSVSIRGHRGRNSHIVSVLQAYASASSLGCSLVRPKICFSVSYWQSIGFTGLTSIFAFGCYFVPLRSVDIESDSAEQKLY